MALTICRAKPRSLTKPPLIHLFSSSSSTQDNDQSKNSQNSQQEEQDHHHQQQQQSFSSYFSDVKASLRQQQQQSSIREHDKTTYSPPPISKSALNRRSFEEIKKNLSEFRLRSSNPDAVEPNSSQQGQHSLQPISFQDLYKRNVVAKSGDDNEAANGSDFGGGGSSNDSKPVAGGLKLDAILQSLRQIKSPTTPTNMSNGGRLAWRNSLKLQPNNGSDGSKSNVIGGTQGLPVAVFGKEMKEEGESENKDSSTEFVKMYSYKELGSKLRSLRYEKSTDEKGWFSLEELNERLRKLRKMEEKETQSKIGGIAFKDLRDSLTKLKMANEDKPKNISIPRLNFLGQQYSLDPPKEHLIDKYFHPDNMSSAEKMKIELAKVRDEFKLSESDCGSARVQVAQLTTKIKHLSSVLHKKDKHSRKGLQEMVQQRKKILKYLRRTDWDSYCFVISKLGLRDNPDYKH